MCGFIGDTDIFLIILEASDGEAEGGDGEGKDELTIFQAFVLTK